MQHVICLLAHLCVEAHIKSTIPQFVFLLGRCTAVSAQPCSEGSHLNLIVSKWGSELPSQL